MSSRKRAKQSRQKIDLPHVGPTSRVFEPNIRQYVNPDLPPQRKPFAAANAERERVRVRHHNRAVQLRDAGVARAEIGKQVADEDGRKTQLGVVEPCSERQVYRWLKPPPA
jgi:hypothetical protein